MVTRIYYTMASVLILIMALIAPVNAAHHGNLEADAYGAKLGTVVQPFPVNDAAAPYAERGLALLHHMTYTGAHAMFVKVVELDPKSAAGYWGQAMTQIHPLWSDPPDEKEFNMGKEMVAEARKRVGNSEEAKVFVEAVGAYYDIPSNKNEKVNLKAFHEGWMKASKAMPDNVEVSSFYALSTLGIAVPSDKTYDKQKEAIALLAPVLSAIPDHPGAHHYTIHASDYPALAAGSLDVARHYGKIAPAVPHALHMPTHIFTRLGLWTDSIDFNTRSAEAAKMHPAGDKVSLHYLHALDYLAYAHLQRGEDDLAMEVQKTMDSINSPLQPHVASAYTLAALPARIALERQQWEAAANLRIRTPNDYPWDNYPSMEALTYFARALGAARMGDANATGAALTIMQKLHDKAEMKSAYWAKQVQIQKLSAAAWLEYELGNKDKGLSMMMEAAMLEGTTEKHPVTPGEVLPARELYADMLLEAGQYDKAETTYLEALKRSPNRFNSLYGAGKAAELRDDKRTAVEHYTALIKITSENARRDRLDYARKYVEENDLKN